MGCTKMDSDALGGEFKLVAWKLSKIMKSGHDFHFASGYFQLCWSSSTWSLQCWVPLWRKPGSLKTITLLLNCWSFIFTFFFIIFILWDRIPCNQDYHDLCSGGWPGSTFYPASQCLSHCSFPRGWVDSSSPCIYFLYCFIQYCWASQIP